jgi:inhibitor of cysteine peptidase
MGWWRAGLMAVVMAGVLVGALAVASGGVPARAQEDGMQPLPCGDFTEADQEITVALGSEFTIALPSNPTTGFSWQLGQELDGTVLELVGSEYIRGRAIPGAGGTECWTFRAAGPGETGITLNYLRPWETDVPPAKTAAFTVTVVE